MSNIRYASIRELDISNGEGVGIALFVQGCRFKCHNCFNSETWDFNGGKEWTSETKKKFLELASKPYIKRISLLGGECLADENLDGILDLVDEIRLSFPNKTIWLYSGYTWEEIFINEEDEPFEHEKEFIPITKRQMILRQCDVMIDGRYIDSKRDISLKWRGSKNQRVIDIKSSLKKGRIVSWKE